MLGIAWMPLISVNAIGDRAVAHGAGAPLSERLAAALDRLPSHAPVVAMLHGFRYNPAHAKADPHSHILSLNPGHDRQRAISWPRHLGLGRSSSEGLAIGLGWPADGTIWQAYRRAETTGTALAEVISTVAALDPGRKVDILAHSLGARVAFSALPLLGRNTVGRVILMAGAEFGSVAAANLATPAGATAECVNITTRENDLFEALLEALITRPMAQDRGIGQGLPQPTGNWLDVQIDKKATLAALATLGFRVKPPHRRICHWSGYLRPGLFGLYRALLSRPGALPLPLLRACLPQAHDPRWSRLFALPDAALPLPLLRNASS